jgi:hypothetical protein
MMNWPSQPHVDIDPLPRDRQIDIPAAVAGRGAGHRRAARGLLVAFRIELAAGRRDLQLPELGSRIRVRRRRERILDGVHALHTHIGDIVRVQAAAGGDA